MNVTISFSPEADKQLRESAARSGQTLEVYIRQLVEGELLGAKRPVRPAQAEAPGNGQVSLAEESEPAAPAGPSQPQGGDPQTTCVIVDPDELKTPWRGVFAPPHDRETIFTTEVEFRVADLAVREPHVNINARWLDDE